MEKKNYIIIGALGGYISGAPIYYRNKALYMKSKGWNVYCVSCRGGKVYVDGLDQFIVGIFPEMVQKPYLLSRKRLRKIIHEIISCIPDTDHETVIETGTFFTAYWGELLAREIGARHTVVYLDEHNQGIYNQQSSFFRFKYEREELACISAEAYKDIFSPFWQYDEKRAYTLPCYCTNSLEDIPSPIIADVKKADCTIGYIGRLEKDAFRALADGVEMFAAQYPTKTIALNCFGDYDNQGASARLKEKLSSHPNIQLYISGFLFPIPKKAIGKCDLCFGSAGSVSVAVKANVPTISMNVYSNLPNGFRIDAKDVFLLTQCPGCSSVSDYLKVFFLGGFRPEMKVYDLQEDELMFKKLLSEHLTFLNRAMEHDKDYYNVLGMGMTVTERFIKFIGLPVKSRLPIWLIRIVRNCMNF